MNSSHQKIYEHVRSAWTAGRTIVPIIGAGASADSGFPALASVVRYLAKLTCFLQHKLYLPSPAIERLFPTHVNDFSVRSDKFISIFGWPDRFQLNADLRGRLDPSSKNAAILESWSSDPRFPSKGLMDIALCTTLDELARKINPGGFWHLDNYLKKLKDPLPEPLNVLSFRYQVVGDWKPLLRHVTRYQPELIDSLFARLARNRNPGTTHILLAHLSRLLRIRTLFTFNFDPFIEAALAKENVAHRVFPMEHGKELPSKQHLDESVSVIKMHGSTHNILVDERVDYRVSERYKQQFLQLIGDEPLLLVMGCSGNDRRLVDLVSDVMDDVPKATVVWIHHQKNPDVPYSLSKKAVSKGGSSKGQASDRLIAHGTYDLGQTLQRLFEYLTDRLPNSVAPYVAHLNRPVIPAPVTNPEKLPKNALHEHAVTLFGPEARADLADFPRTNRNYINALAEVPLNYTLIAIDLEEHHSLEQVVAEIIDQIRRADTLLPPFVTSGGIPHEESQAGKYATRAADRVLFAMRRSRYALCISGIDAFPFRATTHHGVTSDFNSNEVQKYELLFKFVERLASGISEQNRWAKGDSFLVLSYECPYNRHLLDKEKERGSLDVATKTLNENMDQVAKMKGVSLIPPSVPPGESGTQPQHRFSGNADFYLPDEFCLEEKQPSALTASHIVVAAIACHRRTRTGTGIRQLIKDLLSKSGDNNEYAKQLKILGDGGRVHSMPRWMCWTEEKGLWLDRPARDWIYDFNTRATGNEQLKNKNSRGRAFRQALVASILHDRIARNYYLNQFLPSRDPFLFLEYVYHRVSTLRFLAQIQTLLGREDAAALLRQANSADFLCKNNSAELTMAQIAFFADGKDWSLVFEASQRALSAQKSDLKELQSSIRAVRRRCFRGLSQTWTRTESYLRQVLPPDQMIVWCENLLKYNLGEQSATGAVIPDQVTDRLSAVHTKLTKNLLSDMQQTSRTKLIKNLRQMDETAFGMDRQHLRESLRNSLFRSMYAHGSYDKIVKQRWLLPEYESDILAATDASSIHWQLNLRVAHLWNFASNGSDNTSSISRKDLDESIEKAADALRADRGVWEKHSEARLRAHYLDAEVQLIRFLEDCEVHLRAEKPKGQPEWQKNLDALNGKESVLVSLEENLLAAIEEAREENPSVEGPMRNPVLEPTADRGLFIPYRSLFQIQLGRCHLSRAQVCSRIARAEVEKPGFEPNDNKKAFESAGLKLNAARVELKSAYRDLAYSKNGIGAENALLLALADLCCADVAIEGSKLELTWYFRKQWTQGLEMASRSQAKLQTASGYLARCLEQLRQGARFVLIWRHFHITQVTYHTRRIAAIIDDVTVRVKSNETLSADVLTRKTGELARRVRTALTGIRFGLDYSPEHCASNYRLRFVKLWSQLCATALATANILAIVAEIPDASLLDKLLSAWLDMNQSEDMFASRLSAEEVEDILRRTHEKVKDSFDELRSKWNEALDISGLVKLHDFVLDEIASRIGSLSIPLR